MNPSLTFAIFKRNFVSYFSSPTGYVFICVFVLISAWAAFWSNDFFNANLANLDQLNERLPMILLIFIPTVTMGIWAEERRLGTDELLLTIPAGDTEVVLGKYLAAVAIYTAALIFSLSNVVVLYMLGNPDLWMLLGNYVGYWLIGVAMIAIGMVASFLTSNLTVAFILGVAFISPLVGLSTADWIVQDPELAQRLESFSVASQFEPFGRGLITFSSVMYFVSTAVVMLYLCMVMISRRHWSGRIAKTETLGQFLLHRAIALGLGALLVIGWIALFVWPITVAVAGAFDVIYALKWIIALLCWGVVTGITWWFISQSGEHYLVRCLSLGIIAVGLVVLTSALTWRWDISEEQLSSLSGDTRELLRGLRNQTGQVRGGKITPESFRAEKGISARDGEYAGAYLRFTGGVLKDKVRRVARYDGDTRTFHFDSPFEGRPSQGDTFRLERPPVRVEAFVSPEVPELYVQTRLNLLNTLEEFKAIGGNNIVLEIHPTEQLSEEAVIAEDQYGIRPRRVQSSNRGSLKVDEIFMGVAFSCGRERVVVPFFDRGLPVEYELARSITSVSRQQRKKIGIVTTDAELYGSFNLQQGGATPNQAIIDELEKQYDVEQVDPEQEGGIPDEFDALLVVQPSSLGPGGLRNLVAAVKQGIPTALFEDPFPFIDPSVPASSQPRRAPQQGGMFGMNRQPPPPKGNVQELWDLLGVSYYDNRIIYNTYNPYPKFSQLPPEFVFIGDGSGAEEPFSQKSDITSELETLLFVFPGAIYERNDTEMKIDPLVRTGDLGGRIEYDEVMTRDFLGRQTLNPNRDRNYRSEKKEYIVAARITGELPKPLSMADEGADAKTKNEVEAGPESDDAKKSPDAAKGKAEADAKQDAGKAESGKDEPSKGEPAPNKQGSEKKEAGKQAAAEPAEEEKKPPEPAKPKRKRDGINVILVSDIDVLYREFFDMRARGEDPEQDVTMMFDNVTFVLNLLDSLAGDKRFIDIRSRRRAHRTLTAIENRTERAQTKADKEIAKFSKEFEEKQEELQKNFDKKLAEIRDNQDSSQVEKLQKIAMLQQTESRKLNVERERLERELQRKIDSIRRDLELQKREIQSNYKIMAVTWPPVPPLLVGLIVFIVRRLGETRGVAESRLR